MSREKQKASEREKVTRKVEKENEKKKNGSAPARRNQQVLPCRHGMQWSSSTGKGERSSQARLTNESLNVLRGEEEEKVARLEAVSRRRCLLVHKQDNLASLIKSINCR